MVEKSKTYKTKTGRVLTDADIEAMADEAERDSDVARLKVRRRGRPMFGNAPSEVVPVRLDPALRQAEIRSARSDTQTLDRESKGADDKSRSLERFTDRAELLGRAWRSTPARVRLAAGALIVLPVLLIYGALGHSLPSPMGWFM
jgi:hypothetical protein